MDAKRTAAWSNWGIDLWEGDIYSACERLALTGTIGRTRLVGGCEFPCGPQGPCDGFLGSPGREAYKAAIKAWTERGEIVTPMRRYECRPPYHDDRCGCPDHASGRERSSGFPV